MYSGVEFYSSRCMVVLTKGISHCASKGSVENEDLSGQEQQNIIQLFLLEQGFGRSNSIGQR